MNSKREIQIQNKLETYKGNTNRGDSKSSFHSQNKPKFVPMNKMFGKDNPSRRNFASSKRKLASKNYVSSRRSFTDLEKSKKRKNIAVRPKSEA